MSKLELALEDYTLHLLRVYLAGSLDGILRFSERLGYPDPKLSRTSQPIPEAFEKYGNIGHLSHRIKYPDKITCVYLIKQWATSLQLMRDYRHLDLVSYSSNQKVLRKTQSDSCYIVLINANDICL